MGDSVVSLVFFEGQLISGSFDHKIKIWNVDIKPFKERGVMKSSRMGRIFALVLEGNYVFSSSDDCSILAWDVKSQQCLGAMVEHCDVDRAFTFGRGRLFLGCTTGFIKVLGDPLPMGI